MQGPEPASGELRLSASVGGTIGAALGFSRGSATAGFWELPGAAAARFGGSTPSVGTLKRHSSAPEKLHRPRRRSYSRSQPRTPAQAEPAEQAGGHPAVPSLQLAGADAQAGGHPAVPSLHFSRPGTASSAWAPLLARTAPEARGRRGAINVFRSRALELQVKLRAQLAQVIEAEEGREAIGEVTPTQMKIYSNILEAVVQGNPTFAPVLRHVKETYDDCVKRALAAEPPQPVPTSKRSSVVRSSLGSVLGQDDGPVCPAQLLELEQENRKLRLAAGKLCRERRAQQLEDQRRATALQKAEGLARSKAEAEVMRVESSPGSEAGSARDRGYAGSELDGSGEAAPLEGSADLQRTLKFGEGGATVGADETPLANAAAAATAAAAAAGVAAPEAAGASGMSVSANGVRMEPWS